MRTCMAAVQRGCQDSCDQQGELSGIFVTVLRDSKVIDLQLIRNKSCCIKCQWEVSESESELIVSG